MSDQGKNKRVFARIDPNTHRVLEFITERENIEDEWHPDFLKWCVDVTERRARPELGWIMTKKGDFEPFVEPEPDPDMKAMSMLAAGLSVDGKLYHAVGPRYQAVCDEAQYVATFGEFSNGEKSLTLLTKDGEEVKLNSIGDFMKVAKSLSKQVLEWNRFGLSKKIAKAGT